MYTYYIGLNDKDTKKQEITTDKALEYVVNNIAADFTFSICNGVYTHHDGTKVYEVVIRIESTLNLDTPMKDIKNFLNQEVILKVSNGFEIEEFI